MSTAIPLDRNDSTNAGLVHIPAAFDRGLQAVADHSESSAAQAELGHCSPWDSINKATCNDGN